MIGDGATGRARGALLVAPIVVIVAMLAGCGFILPDRIHYEWQPDTATICTNCAVTDGAGAMVGLALSGGGSRAAVFGAAVLAALAEQGHAERISHISSVSGGGFAASYYMINPLAATCPAGDADPACRAAYFAAFDGAMRLDFTTATFLNQLASPGRITSPTRRATSLQEALDAGYINGATFGDLPSSPIVLFNTASYDDGRRFVFSNTVLNEMQPDYAPLSQDVLRASSFSRADCAQPTPSDMSLSLAVVASAAFPPVIGPVTVQAQRSCADATPQYWHLGDGGIVENTGIDTLRELMVRGVHDGSLTSALILVADASAPWDSERSLATADLSVFTSNPGVVVDIAQARGNAYADLYWAGVRESIGIPFDTIVFRFDRARIADWPETCAAEQQSGRSINQQLSAIPTGLDISDCDADLVASAARDLVRRRLDASPDILRRHGLLPAGDAVAAIQ